MNELQPILLHNALGYLLPLDLGISRIYNLGQVSLDCRPLDFWGILGHDYIAFDPQPLSNIGQSLPMIPRRVCDHTLNISKLQEFVARPTSFIGSHLLEILAFKVDSAFQELIDGVTTQHRGFVNVGADALGRLEELSGCGLHNDLIFMFDKLKHTLAGVKEAIQEDKQPKIQIEIVSLVSGEELKASKKLLEKIKDDLQFIQEITRDNKAAVAAYIQQQKLKPKKAQTQGEGEGEEDFTLADDVAEVGESLKGVMGYLVKIETLESQLKLRVDKYNVGGGHNPEAEAKLARCEQELRKVRESEKNEKQIVETLRQQCVLYTEETRKLQDRISKAEKQIAERSATIANLTEQKQLLLDMKNSTNPELEGMKAQTAEFEKRLALEKTRYTQKEKEAESLRKKLEEQRANLQAMADQLKEKELKSKKVLEKYDRSKQQIRRYREEKTELIGKLQSELQVLKDQAVKAREVQDQLRKQILGKDQEAQQLRTKYDNTVASNLRSLNLEEQNKVLSDTLREKQHILQTQSEKITELKDQNQKLQEKRQSLLAALEKPVKHEVKTLEKIHKAMEGLYKDFIIDVFDRGDTVQFEKKISTIMTNIIELKEDLLM